VCWYIGFGKNFIGFGNIGFGKKFSPVQQVGVLQNWFLYHRRVVEPMYNR